MTTRNRLIFVALAVVWVGSSGILSTIRWINDKETHKRAEEWLQDAQRDAKADTDPEDAIRWLRQEGVRPYWGEEKIVDSVRMENNVIMGFRVMSKETFWTKPQTAQLTFHFDKNWHFASVELKLLPFEFP